MTRLPFTVTHAGMSVLCFLHVTANSEAKLLEFGSLRSEANAAALAAKVQEHIEFLNDLMAADMPFEALMTCRRSPGLFGAILDPAATELENLRGALKCGDSDAA